MVLKCELKKGIGKKSGKEYIAISIEFPNGYKKMYFPQNSDESWIWEQCYSEC